MPTDGDGVTDSGELQTFASLGITRINLAAVRQSGEIRDGNEVLSRGTYVRSGVTREALAVSFLADPNGTTSTSGNIIRNEGGTQSTYVATNPAGETVTLGIGALTGVRSALGGNGNGNDSLAGDDMLLVDAAGDFAVLRGRGLDAIKVIGDAGVAKYVGSHADCQPDCTPDS